MALIDKEFILNSNPTKKLRMAFENLKSNYNDSSAKAYMESYKDQPLAFIIENSRYIFSEPMYGLKFYSESVISNEYALLFTEYENEKEKIETYLEENGNNMSEAQRKMYEDLLSLVTEKYNDTINTSTIISHACTNQENDTEYKNLTESVYSLRNDSAKIEELKTFIESTKSADLFYALSPYLVKLTNGEVNYETTANMNRFFKECAVVNHTIDKEEWKHYIESMVIVSKLYGDKIYAEAVSEMRRQNSMIFEGLALESVKSQMDELFVEHITENAGANKFNANTFDCFYSTPYNAVNRIFEDNDMYSIMKEDNEKFKMERTKLYEIAVNVLFEYVTHEYHVANDVNSSISGYNYFTEGTSIEKAFSELAENSFIAKEAQTDDEDVSDDDITNIDKEITGGNSPKKAVAPKAKNLATKIQNKAMDAEADYIQRRAEAQQKGHEAKNAIRAVTAIPRNIADSIKNTFSEFDKMDDDRRKKYMLEPGYRKKIFRNLKVAITYGAAASMRLSLIPVVYVARRLSKQKNMRIRNELARELDTNIKLCDVKIEDAAQNNDNQEKYRLIRIKAKLEQEALRVKANSKYI